jgi:uncharacterized alkaline shock family protein YloU
MYCDSDDCFCNNFAFRIIFENIKISEDDEGLEINCEIIVYFGVSIPQLCYDIQTRVKQDIETIAGERVKAVNIRIEGIDKRN